MWICITDSTYVDDRRRTTTTTNTTATVTKRDAKRREKMFGRTKTLGTKKKERRKKNWISKELHCYKDVLATIPTKETRGARMYECYTYLLLSFNLNALFSFITTIFCFLHSVLIHLLAPAVGSRSCYFILLLTNYPT